jgi:hypothetical protein
MLGLKNDGDGRAIVPRTGPFGNSKILLNVPDCAGIAKVASGVVVLIATGFFEVNFFLEGCQALRIQNLHRFGTEIH